MTEFHEQAVRQAQQNAANMAADWDAIRSWECDDCGAGPGVWCTNRVTKEPMGKLPGHLNRIRKALNP